MLAFGSKARDVPLYNKEVTSHALIPFAHPN